MSAPRDIRWRGVEEVPELKLHSVGWEENTDLLVYAPRTVGVTRGRCIRFVDGEISTPCAGDDEEEDEW